MLAKAVATMLEERQAHFLIPASIVANVQEDNHLDHAFMVLTKVRYAKIPVLDNEQRFKGLISLAMITDKMMGLNGIDPGHLGSMVVKDVMEKDVPTITLPYDMEKILHLLVDQPFLVVVDQHQTFTGIVTRREVMKCVNYIAHDLERQYMVTPLPAQQDDKK